MGNKASGSHRARRLERERQRRKPTNERTPRDRSTAPADADSRARRTAATDCGWCGGPITPGRRGPIPKWCSATCRHRAWEQARAAASDRSAVQVVERRVEISRPVTLTRRDWARLLDELARQLDDGPVYDRDLRELASALDAVLQAYRRRPYVRDRTAAGRPL